MVFKNNKDIMNDEELTLTYSLYKLMARWTYA